MAGRLGVGEVLLLGRGEQGSGTAKASILADAFEAILGAVYLDAGWEAAQRLVLRELGDAIGRAGEEPDDLTTKPAPGEGGAWRRGDPRYVVVGSGRTTTGSTSPRCFSVGRLGPRRGPFKKDAEREAARSAWEGINNA